MKKYLTKTLFKNVLDCRTKLYYATNSHKYKDNRITDPFLKSIAEGGFQVGELAKCYYPDGIEIDSSLNIEENFKQTQRLLKRKNVVIFEGVLIFEKFSARFDILVKRGDTIRLVEVKSKSYSGGDFTTFLYKNKLSIKKDWIDNMYDIAYQKWIIEQLYPNYTIETNLMLADKSKTTTVDNLNQKFILASDKDGRSNVIVNGDTSKESLGEPILTEVGIDEVMVIIENHEYTGGRTFDEWLYLLLDSFLKNEKLPTTIGNKCKSCQFTCTEEEEKEGWKSGKKECWSESGVIGEENLDKPTVLDIWNYRKKDKKIKEGNVLLENFETSEFLPQIPEDKLSDYYNNLNSSLDTKERQALQVWKTKTGDESIYVNKEKLKEEMESWTFPLHMIDFETTAVAIPFHKGLRPYEGVAFQFSHHIIKKDGTIEHKGEYINRKVGHFPSFDFVRALKKELENDEGSVFMYSSHENTYLNMILQQLLNFEGDIPDKEQLVKFIQSITRTSSGFRGDLEHWKGDRYMVDLLDILKKYYYNPYAGGSNSIKDILPAILKSSQYLKNKYSEPIYGNEIKSKNFKNKTWIEFDDEGEVIDPYKQLPYAFEGIDENIKETFINTEQIADGGAAMTAYARIQFTQMSELERNSVINSLLKYCELDTFAMVMLWEHWQEVIYEKKYEKKSKKNQTINKKDDIKNETNTNLKEKVMRTRIGKRKMTQTERWIRRFKKDSTKQLEKKTSSSHYNPHQLRIIEDILDWRKSTPIYCEKVVRRMKKENSRKLKRMLRSNNYNGYEKHVVKDILTTRGVNF